jgi:site-specific recombinase XerD
MRCYEGHLRQVAAAIGARRIGEIAADPSILADYVSQEIHRLGRTHTVKKRLEAIIKPTLKFAAAKGEIDRVPLFPRLRSDYRGEGNRTAHLTRAEFASLRAELPEVATMAEDGRRCFPRLWLDLAVTTGMHASDLDRFAAADFEPGAGLWLRRNTKGDAHYRPEWLPCDAFLRAVLSDALRARGLAGDALFTVDARRGDPRPLPKQWMRRRLHWACKRAGVAVVPSPNDLRRTCATWHCEDGWDFEETAKWLANSSGMVRQVYAQIPRAAMVRAVERTDGAASGLLRLTAALDRPRRPPRRRSGAPVLAKTRGRRI